MRFELATGNPLEGTFISDVSGQIQFQEKDGGPMQHWTHSPVPPSSPSPHSDTFFLQYWGLNLGPTP
jgi:hypothetical protein